MDSLSDGLRGRKVFFDPLYGNHGDTVIRLVAQELIKDWDFQCVSSPEKADVILLNGGGSMVEGWFGPDKLAKYHRHYPEKPLVVWPSSFYLPHTDLATLFPGRNAPVFFWTRDVISQELLRARDLPPFFNTEVEHDLAFKFQAHPSFQGLDTVSKELLVVERDDWEGTTGRRRPFAPAGLEMIPQRLRTLARRALFRVRRKRDDRSPFSLAAQRFVREEHPDFSPDRVCVGDISLPEVCEFSTFLSTVFRAGIIVTNRLHVAILGHLLNKIVYLVEGSYHKCQGVYEHSMQGGQTQLLRWDAGTQRLVRAVS